MQLTGSHKVTITLADIIAKLLPSITAELGRDIPAEAITSAYDARKKRLVLTFDTAWEAEADAKAAEAGEDEAEYEHEILVYAAYSCSDEYDADANMSWWPTSGDKVTLELTTGAVLDVVVKRVDGDGDLYVALPDQPRPAAMVQHVEFGRRTYPDAYDGPERLPWACERVVRVRW